MLGIAIGACVAVFGVVHRVMVQPLPFPNPSELVALSNSWPLFIDGRLGEVATHAAAPYTRIARYDFGRATLTGVTPARIVKVAEVSRDFFTILGKRAAAGRFLDPSGESGAIVLSAALRRTLYATEGEALGRTLVLNGRSHLVIGIAPEDLAFYDGGEKVEAWIPRIEDKPLIQSNQQTGSGAIARLRPNVNMTGAASALNLIKRRIAARHPELRIRDGDRIGVTSLRDHWFGSLERPLLMLFGAAASLLVIAIANATGLLLARAASQRRDAAIRMALGGSRADLLRASLAEALLLGAIAIACGLLLAKWGTQALITLSPARIPGGADIGITPTAVMFAVLVALPAVLLPCIVTARRASRFDLLQGLGIGGLRGTFVSPRLRRVLVSGQVAISVALLINAALLLRSFQSLRTEQMGFDPRGVLTMELAPPADRYPDAAARLTYYRQLIDELRSKGLSAGIVNFLPLFSGSYIIPVVSEGRTQEDALSWSYRSASPDYFRLMRIPLVAGRAFGEADRVGAPPVAIVDRSAARQLVGDSIVSAIGRHVVVNFSEPTTVEIIGIVEDIRQQGLGIESYPGFYVSGYQRPLSVANLVIRPVSHADVSSIHSTLQSFDSNLPIASLHDLEGTVAETVSQRRFAVVVTAIIGVAALILSLLGLGALMSQLVTYRTHEIGVRVALGARGLHVVGLVVRQGLAIVVLGIATGIAGAFAGTRLLSGLLYGIAPTDPIAFVLVPLGMLGVAALACAHPTIRALRSDPMVALRAE